MLRAVFLGSWQEWVESSWYTQLPNGEPATLMWFGMNAL